MLSLLCFAALSQNAMAAQKKVIGYYMDASDDYYKAGFEVFKKLAERKGWRSATSSARAPRPSSSTLPELHHPEGRALW